MPDSDAARARAALTSSGVRFLAWRNAILLSSGDDATLGSCRTTEGTVSELLDTDLTSQEWQVGLHLAAEATRSSRIAIASVVLGLSSLHLVAENVCRS